MSCILTLNSPGILYVLHAPKFSAFCPCSICIYVFRVKCVSCEVRTEFVYIIENKFIITLCRGGVEYLYRSLAARGRRRKGNPVPVSITGPPCSWGIWIRRPGPPGWGSLESEAVKCDHVSRATRIWEWSLWRGSGAIVNDKFILSSKRMLHKD
jgi:hypothetical protein